MELYERFFFWESKSLFFLMCDVQNVLFITVNCFIDWLFLCVIAFIDVTIGYTSLINLVFAKYIRSSFYLTTIVHCQTNEKQG